MPLRQLSPTGYPNAKITLGGVPMEDQNFSWSAIPGASPFMRSFKFHKDFYSKLASIGPRTNIQGEVWGTSINQPSKKSFKFDNVWIVEFRQVDEFFVEVVVADNRWSFRGKKLTCGYNHTRTRNQLSRAPLAYNNTPAELSENFRVFSPGRYLSWSVKSDRKPYSVREILHLEFQKLGIYFDPNIGDDIGSFIVENIEYDNVDIYSGLSELCGLSRLTLGIIPNGAIYVYSQDWYDRNLAQNFPNYFNKYDDVTPTHIYLSDKKKSRPKSLTIRFKRKDETRIVLSGSENIAPNFEWGADPIPIPNKYRKLYDDNDVSEGRIISCLNVIQTPIPIQIEVNRREGPPQIRTAQIGEYVPIADYFKAINLTEDYVKRFWFSSLLENKYAFDEEVRLGVLPNLQNRLLAIQKINPIRASYRQVFQIDPYWMDRIDKLEARRITIIDTYSRYTPTSPLFADFCTILKCRNPMIAKGLVPFREPSYNWNVLEQDPFHTNPIAGTVSVVNEKLGIFKINYQFDNFGQVAQIIPSCVNDRPDSAPVSANKLWIQSTLYDEFTMSTIMSIVWKAGRLGGYDDFRKYWFVPIQLQASDVGEGPEIEYLSDLEFARFPAREFDEEGNLRIDPSQCTNLGDIEAIANSEAKKIMNSYIDRVSGLMTIHGLYPGYLSGHMASITYTYNSSNGLSSTVDLRTQPPAPNVQETLPANVLRKVKRQITVNP